jgi:hypothetical protein
MQEDLLQFIWQYGLFQAHSLVATNNEAITIISRGSINKNAGPDFLSAKIKVGTTILVGNIEVHIKTSDWFKHQHQKDPAYHNLILHVVYEDDAPIWPYHFPVLALKDYIGEGILQTYQQLMQHKQDIACANLLSSVSALVKYNWQQRLLLERWEMKLLDWKLELANNQNDWQQLLMKRLIINFGFNVNAAGFDLLSKSIPNKLLIKAQSNPLEMEALLFGQAGFLEEYFTDDYYQQLQAHYTFIRHKYQLQPLQKHIWKFMRMRPVNFPTIRIAQLAALLCKSTHMCAMLSNINSLNEIRTVFKITASSYWDNHVRFGKETISKSSKNLGESAIDTIFINTLLPFLFLQASYEDNYEKKMLVMDWLQSIKAEQNAIIEKWSTCAWRVNNALDSQSLLQLYNYYCLPKKCLHCAIGLSIFTLRP